MSSHRARVLVAGLGAMGSAAAAALARQGAAVLGIDPLGPGHQLGSSHGESRIIRQAYFENPGYVPLVLRAYRLWAELEAKTGERLLERTGGVMLGTPESRVVRGALASAERWRLPHQLLERAELQRRFPALLPAPGQVGLLEPEAGVLAPERAVLCQLREAADSGAELHFGERLLDWESVGASISVRTDRGRHNVDRLVLCCGAWSGPLLGEANLPLTVERQAMVWFRPRDIRAFSAPLFPVYIAEVAGGDLFYGLPSRDRLTTKAAQHHGGQSTTAEDVDRQVSSADLESLRAGLAEIAPDLAVADVERTSVCMYTNTPDQDFVLGPHPASPGVMLAAGFSGHGFKFAPVVGEILADLALRGGTEEPISAFDPARFQLTT